MNKRTILLAAFTVLVLAQWAVPSSMILRREASLRQGKEFKLRVRPLDPYDAFRGRFVRLDFDVVAVAPPGGGPVVPDQKAYALLKADSAGFAMVESVSLAPPDSNDYLAVTLQPEYNLRTGNTGKAQIVWPFDRYYMEEAAAPEAERIYRERARNSMVYVTVRISRGTGVITGLYLDGQPIEEIVRKP